MGRRITRLLASATAAAAVALAGCTSDQLAADDLTGSLPPTPESPATRAAGSPEEPAPGSLEEQTRDLVRCLNDRGWETEILPGSNTYRTVVPPEQHDQYNADIEECNIEIGVDIGPPQVTPEEASELYDILLEIADCVRDLGYNVPEAPSRQSFVEDLVSHPIPSWHPYDPVYEAGRMADIQRVEAECPIPHS
jgi:hypothetical protein